MTNFRSLNLGVLGEACCQTADRKCQQLTQEPPRCTVCGLTFPRTSLPFTLVNNSAFASVKNLFALHSSTVMSLRLQISKRLQPRQTRRTAVTRVGMLGNK